MSDFIYSKESIKKGKLIQEVQSIYQQDGPSVEEFHGEWGSLAVSQNLYNGFQPYENSEHICVVIGGPVLYFRDNKFLNNNSGVAGTKAIYDRWREGVMQWDEDLSGPFAILIINKQSSEVTCKTDLMSFIPVFSYQKSSIMLSTHVDLLANVADQQANIDVISKVDFILHGVVTFPFTMYNAIRQIKPATEYSLISSTSEFQSNTYWLPEEKNMYQSIDKAADDLRNGIQKYVDLITNEMSHIAQFISGGEDSRTISGLLPKDTTRDAFIFLDDMNREGKVAKRAANAYGANFNLAKRGKLHYLEILPLSTKLVGGGSQYFHAHTYGFHKSCKLDEYPAVFGGLFSDVSLKGACVKKFGGSGRFPFVPHIKRNDHSVDMHLKNNTFMADVLSELTKRRQAHLDCIKRFRSESAEEWFQLWPISMNINIPNLHSNRRLFRTYEPFMAKDAVKISAAVPQKWKLNRRLFQKATKPLLKPTKWLFHVDGRLPYYPWYINSFVQFTSWINEGIGKRTGLIRGNQGPWTEWSTVMNSAEWEQAMSEYSSGMDVIGPALKEKDVSKLFESKDLNYVQKINLMQTLYSDHKRK
ncbi:Asparagine synthetase B (glutamine-hydrolyzing) [Virgibacillus subterraneus]|uniref:asparagine synthase (glutamine-hydrolyzing) n=1 Tax=Virgibacillus subterraneus TaxID=621109 RepID=A0A1H9AL10_9BACI|nr:hypothetical protein [Virgibacillus subterraneus]SEP76628.1 Asparagine synthetase B (glutamine-hydrolyzing) [Virgibacillus subterraneus]